MPELVRDRRQPLTARPGADATPGTARRDAGRHLRQQLAAHDNARGRKLTILVASQPQSPSVELGLQDAVPFVEELDLSLALVQPTGRHGEQELDGLQANRAIVTDGWLASSNVLEPA